MTYWKRIKLNKHQNDSGMLTVIEHDDNFDFDVKRVFFLSNITFGSIRGEHAHKNLKQIIIAVSGSLKITLDNGTLKEEITLIAGGDGLYVDGMVWRTMRDFSPDAVMMVLCDRVYNDDVVIRDYDEFRKNL